MLSAKVYDIPASLSEEDLENALKRLPQWRLEKALSYRYGIDRFLCAESFLILEEMIRKNHGLDHCPEFSYGEYGKPCLKEFPEIHFNISHCRKGIACALSCKPVGIDIEEIQYDPDVAAMILDTEERTAVEMTEEKAVKFTELWTRKESYLKFTGTGIRDNLKDVLKENSSIKIITHTNRSAGYVVSVAGPDVEIQDPATDKIFVF